MQITEQQLDELAEELQDRTSDFLNEEVWELLYDSGLITETDDTAIVLCNKLLFRFLHPNLTSAWKKSDLTFNN